MKTGDKIRIMLTFFLISMFFSTPAANSGVPSKSVFLPKTRMRGSVPEKYLKLNIKFKKCGTNSMVNQIYLMYFTCIFEAKLQFTANWFEKIRFPLLQFSTNRINQSATILPMFIDVQPSILVTVFGNVFALNNMLTFYL